MTKYQLNGLYLVVLTRLWPVKLIWQRLDPLSGMPRTWKELCWKDSKHIRLLQLLHWPW